MNRSYTLTDRLFGKPNSLLHPNRITCGGGIMSAAAVACMFSPITMPFAPPLALCAYATDGIDGNFARRYDLTTLEGAKLDPLFDKIKNLIVGSYMITEEITSFPVLTSTIGANFIVDYISQRKRGPIFEQLKEAKEAILNPQNCTKDTQKISKLRANVFGKIKTGIQTTVGMIYITQYAWQENISNLLSLQPEQLTNISNNYIFPTLLATSAICGSIGILKRIKKTA